MATAPAAAAMTATNATEAAPVELAPFRLRAGAERGWTWCAVVVYA